jgi:uncharacterized protein YecE (DUF72 family)
MKLLAGTSGFSYKEWKGAFYPDKIRPDGMLAFYAGRLPIVEINNTFYRLPKPEQLREWRAQVPPTFRFAVKAPRRITHVKRLADCAGEMQYLLTALRELDPMLGSILFQLPPFQRCDLPRLSTFTDLLPEGCRAAFEFRHASWHDDGVYALLAARNFALVMSETDDSGPLDLPWTARWAYLRLRKTDYTNAQLQAWLDRLRAAPLDEAQVFFKHEDEAKGPLLAEWFLNRSSGVSDS